MGDRPVDRARSHCLARSHATAPRLSADPPPPAPPPTGVGGGEAIDERDNFQCGYAFTRPRIAAGESGVHARRLCEKGRAGLGALRCATCTLRMLGSPLRRRAGQDNGA